MMRPFGMVRCIVRVMFLGMTVFGGIIGVGVLGIRRGIMAVFL